MTYRFFLTTVAVLMFLYGNSQTYVKLEINKHNDLIGWNTMSYGIKFDNKKGKIRKRGSLYKRHINVERFQVKMEGASFYDYDSRIAFNRKKVIENNGAIPISYCHPKKKDLIVYDTIFIPLIDSISFGYFEISHGAVCKPVFNVTFTNGEVRTYSDLKFMSLMKRNNCIYSIKNGTLSQEGLLSIKEFNGELESAFLEMEVYTQTDTFLLRKDYSYRTQSKCDFSGGSGSSYKRYSSGQSGQNGENVRVHVEMFNDTLCKIKVIGQSSQRKHHFIFNPEHGKLIVYSRGGSGGSGGRGSRGSDAPSERSGDYLRKGETGGAGGSGGNGGHGGNVTIFMPKAFSEYLDCIVVYNDGGIGGEGGSGGKGGRNQMTPEEEGKAINILFPDRASYGADGAHGSSGQRGQVDYVIID